MEMIVCVKRVPLTQEVDLEINPQKTDVRKDMLAYAINEWDNYAIEEAVILKEKQGGTVTAVTVGTEEDEEVLRRCLAMGADKAIRVETGDLSPDSVAVARILAQVIKGMPHDLVLTGVQADDLNEGSVGTMVAEFLNLAHAAVVTNVTPEGTEQPCGSSLKGAWRRFPGSNFRRCFASKQGLTSPGMFPSWAFEKRQKKN
jgi:electron transfer flavoprotein beta subunit